LDTSPDHDQQSSAGLAPERRADGAARHGADAAPAVVGAGANDPDDNLHAIAIVLASDHWAGAAHAKVLLLEYGDYECASCSAAEPLTEHLVKTFGAHLRFVYRHFPLGEHPHAERAAEAAEAAAAQDKFWLMHHLLFTHWEHLAPDDLKRYAQMAGLDMPRFNVAMAERTYRARVQEHRDSGEAIGLHGLPTFFVDGARVDVSFGPDHLERAVRAALEPG
jgi:protein-disulfide isomerase